MNILWILLAAAATAWGVRGALQRDVAAWLKALATLAFLFCGLTTVLLVWWVGDGRLLPTLQISPDVRNWFATNYDGGLPAPDPLYLLVGLVAHVALLVLARSKRGAILWPATLVFLAATMWFSSRQSDRPIAYRRALGPATTAYLTVAPTKNEGARLVFAHGASEDGFVDVIHVAESEKVPIDIQLFWTNDGQAIVLQVGRRRTFALKLDGTTVGYLPARSHEWPEENASLESGPVRKRLAKAAKDVDVFLREHGGVFVR